MFKDGKIAFKNESNKSRNKSERVWNILIIDDEPDIHEVTELSLAGFEFDNRKCRFIHAYSAKEARDILINTPNIALALIDVVMETDDAGLILVDYIRKELGNKVLRIILRTGQPGQAPEERVINDYDINDYKGKSELTTQKLYTSVLTSLRSYRDMIALERNRQGLIKVIEATSSIVQMSSLELFLSAVLEQILALLHLNTSEVISDDVASFIALVKDDTCLHIAGSGIYSDITNEKFCQESSVHLRPYVNKVVKTGKELHEDGHYILYRPSVLDYKGFVLYMEMDIVDELDQDLIRLFFDKATAAYENAALNSEIDASQKETIFTLSEIAEHRCNESGKHVKRVALYAKLLAEAYGLSKEEVDYIYAASPMHDIGKLAIEDRILQKPDDLTDAEMKIMKTHAQIGYEILSASSLEIMQVSAVIAKEHHEKYDGSGYPSGLKGEEISIYARIVALADVFDALGSRRVYKEQWKVDKVFDYIQEERGKQFDPKLVDLFFEHKETVLKIHKKYKDK